MDQYKNNVNMEPFNRALLLISGKWKMHILFWLSEVGTIRYGEIRRALGSITHKMLASRLKELEEGGLVIAKSTRKYHLKSNIVYLKKEKV